VGIQGKVIVFTGKISQPRHAFQAMVEEHGGIAGGDVTKNTDYLVVGEKPGSKLVRATMLGVPTISESQFLKLLEEPAEQKEEEPDYCGTGPGSLCHHWFRKTIKDNGDIVEDCLCGTVKITHPDGTWTKHEPRHVIEQARRIAHKHAVERERQFRLRQEEDRRKERGEAMVLKQLEALNSSQLAQLEEQLNEGN